MFHSTRIAELEAENKALKEMLWLKCPGEDAILIVPNASDSRWLVGVKACHNHPIMTEGEFSRELKSLKEEVAQMEKKLEAAEKMAEALETIKQLNFEQKILPSNKSGIQGLLQADEAIALWNTANERNPNA